MMLKERRSSNATHVWYHRAGSAASRLTPADVPDGLIESARVLHLTGITPALSTDAHATVRAAVGRARAAGVLVSFDVNHRGRLWSASCARPAYRDLVTASGLVFAGLDEARLILDDDLLDAEAACAELHGLGAATVVIKLGGDGALLSDADGRIHRAAIPVDVVDTVGAGDAFVSGFLAALVTRADRVQALEAGIRSGALACTAAGDWEGLPAPRTSRHSLPPNPSPGESSARASTSRPRGTRADRLGQGQATDGAQRRPRPSRRTRGHGVGDGDDRGQLPAQHERIPRAGA